MPAPRPATSRALRRAALALAALLLPLPGAGQTFRFEGLDWGTPADTLQARMAALQWRHVRTYETGDLRFRSPEDRVAVAFFGAGRLVGVTVFHPVPAPELDSRHEAVMDSLTRAHGKPAGERAGVPFWLSGLTWLGVRKEEPGEDSLAAVALLFSGPGYSNEMRRRSGVKDPFPALGRAWTVLNVMQEGRLAVDTASISRQGPGVHRVRVRIDYPEVQPDLSGRFDALVYGYDFDCARRRTQMRSRTALLRGARVRHDEGATVWVPVRKGTTEEWQLDVVCQFVTDRAAARGA